MPHRVFFNMSASRFMSKKWLLPWVVSIAMFIDTLDSTIVSVAIPRIADSFQINPVDMKLALTSYLLSLAIFIPISGWLADRYGQKRIFIFAIIVFTASSFACALANNLAFLILARLIQGFGGALMIPVGRLIILRSFPKEEFGQAMSLVVVPGLLGPALGPTLGGLILHIASWHWIFLVNIPFGILGSIIAYLIITPSEPQITRPFKWHEFVLFSLGLVCLTLSLALLGDKFSLLNHALIMAGIGLLCVFFYWRLTLKQQQPLLDLRLLQQKTFRTSILVTLLVRPSAGATSFLLPLLLQVLWGETALFSGLCFMFLALGMLFTRFLVSSVLLTRYSIRNILIVAIVLLLTSSMNLCWFSQPQPAIYLIALLFFIGMATVLLYTCVGSMSVLEMQPHQFSQSTSISSTMQQFSLGCGIAIAAVVLHLVSQITHQPLFSQLVFFWTFIILNSLGFTAIYFALALDPTLRVIKKPE